MRTEKYKVAEATWQEVLGIYESLIASSPNVLLYERRHSDTLESLAELKIRQGDRDAARNYLDQAIEDLSLAIKRNPNSPIIRLQLNRLINRANRQANAEKTSGSQAATGK